jgi:ubiquinone/menaquinone biosynthesis C-methylase UbiE
MGEKIKNFYDDLYRRKKERTMRPFYVYQRWLDFFSLEKDTSILDIGCGTGHFLKAAEDYGLKTYGIDISEEAVRIAKKIAPGSQIEVGEGEELKYPDAFFDYVACLGSLEHFSNLEQGLGEMLRVAKNGAKFLIIVPNKNYLWDKVLGKKGTIQRDYKEELKNFDSWKKLFESHGLETEKVTQDKYPAEIVKIFEYKNPTKILRRILYRLIWLFMPLRYTYQFIFVFRKKCKEEKK